MDRIATARVESVTFGVFTSEKIKKLSVKEITNVAAFDRLEHPIVGGLYDPALGTTERDESCATCGLNYLNCPGHIGHISLPLPVFNPFFIRDLFQILRGSCFKCHCLIIPPCAAMLLKYQFKALDYGLEGTVHQLGEAANAIVATEQGNRKVVSDGMRTVILELGKKLQSIFDAAVVGVKKENVHKLSMNASVLECRQRIRKELIKKYILTTKAKCPYCFQPRLKLKLRQNVAIVFTSTAKMTKEDDPIDTESEQASKHLTPVEAKKHLSLVWQKEKFMLQSMFGILNKAEMSDEDAINIFFMENIIVSAIRFRPLSMLKGMKYMNQRSGALREILEDKVILHIVMKFTQGMDLTEEEQDVFSKLQGKTPSEKLRNQWGKLQMHVNAIVDSDMDKLSKGKTLAAGVKQTLEKKEGLFRKHMMGKRVNFVARSVISPDPYIMVDEVGVPELFAKKLTYPEPVTDWNYHILKQAVLNGPNVHPGAVKIENEDGIITLISPDCPMQRRALACQLMTPSRCQGMVIGPKKVHRHVINGDILLLNRQPTLHKPSIMGHKARILRGEKTLRLHFANCKSYNADFDGDEMNAHFPQNYVAKSEGHNIVSVNHQYLVPKDGTPLTGLIQDHIASGTLLTMRGRFFNKLEYNQLVYNAMPFLNSKIETLRPCIMKPKELWSGKQVVSTVLMNLIPEGAKLLTLDGIAKVQSKHWQNKPSRPWNAGGTPLIGDDMSESQVIIRNGELHCGVLDKAHIGATPYGLIHCCYELYGGNTSSLLLSAFGRLFTYFLSNHGFSFGFEDILLTDEASRKRKKIMKRAKKSGGEAVAKAFNVSDPNNVDELKAKYEEAHLSRDPTALKLLDFEMKKKTNAFVSDINEVCMPSGLLRKFPENNLQLMILSGSKGSNVNASQISSLLGQIELEGRRVPLMMNGSSLPSFLPYDLSPRAGGFVDGRFLTGIKPQEYFFHCMAGREGLVDTAVKTSRSGYLQRCLIKHLEGVTVHYDLTVRDSDGTVLQFSYGEDGFDVTKMQMLKKEHLSILAQNFDFAKYENELQILKKSQMSEGDPAKLKKKISEWQRKHVDCPNIRSSSIHDFIRDRNLEEIVKVDPKKVQEDFRNLDRKSRKRYDKLQRKCPDPVNSQLRPDLTLGSVSEKLDKIIEDYVNENPKSIYNFEQGLVVPKNTLTADQFRDMCYFRALRSLADPGEAVGLLAAQSIGEPSTQMTLNTFHFAGKGDLNVTLGIPRLREILMVASANIATPTMDLPLLNIDDVEMKAQKLCAALTAVSLKEVLEFVKIEDILSIKRDPTKRFRLYVIRMQFLPYEAYEERLYTNPSAILDYIQKDFIHKVIAAMNKKVKAMVSNKLINTEKIAIPQFSLDAEAENEVPDAAHSKADDGESSDEGEDGDGDAVDKKNKDRHDQDLEYEEPEEEDVVDESAEDEDMECNITVKEEAAEVDEMEGNEVVDFPHAQNYQTAEEMKKTAIMNMKKVHDWVQNYDYDIKRKRWCQITLQLPVKNSKLDMRTLVEEVIEKCVLHQVRNIKRAFLVANPNSINGTTKMIKTEGVNFLEIFKYGNIIDVQKVYSNDIHEFARVFGIQAAIKVLIKEIKNVFGTYAIAVDPRHLSLIAEYMTSSGVYKPFNRLGLESNSSPFQKITFETTMNFVRDATLNGCTDLLQSPSSRLIFGQHVRCGTGFFDLFGVRQKMIFPHKK